MCILPVPNKALKPNQAVLHPVGYNDKKKKKHLEQLLSTYHKLLRNRELKKSFTISSLQNI